VRRRPWPIAAVLGGYLLLAAIYTWPLLRDRSTRIASDPGDPILTASVLWWNATTTPFSDRWWTPPLFYPNDQVSALTENFVGESVVASPVFWLTRDPILAFNVAVFLTWPLSAFAAYLLVRSLTRREDAAIVAGVAFGFAPYRVAQLSHMQVLSAYWLPIALLGLHKYLHERRVRWLIVFGAAWLLQALSNLYFAFFGGIVITLWLLYFGSQRDARRTLPPIAVAWFVASLPLVPVLLKYRAILDHFGLSRSMGEIVGFSAQPWAWTQVSDLTSLWPHVLGDTSTELDLFPGVTSVVLILGAAIVWWRRRGALDDATPNRRLLARNVLTALATVLALAAVMTMVIGSWRFDIGPLRVSMGDGTRGIAGAILLGLGAAACTRRSQRLLASRPAIVFYAGTTIVVMGLACGPVLAYHSKVLLDPTPYRWLMRMPGFSGLRVPARFWMMGTMCLGVAGGLAFARLVPASAQWRSLACAAVVCGLLADGWLRAMPMGQVPEAWPIVEPPSRAAAVLELPLGPDFDAAATFRSMFHRRRTVNGVSGYDPPAYTLLQQGLKARDTGIIPALASFGPIDVIVDSAHDPDGALARYVTAIDGAKAIATDGVRTAFELPRSPPIEPPGEYWPIQRATASADDANARLAIDGNVGTQWQVGPQQPGQWIAVDLGVERLVGGIEQAIGHDLLGYPRVLAVDVSLDGQSWKEVFSGQITAPAFLGAIERPREIPIRLAFRQQQTRFVRLRQMGTFEGGWTVAELRVFVRPGPRYP
jgi:F5/8 type C domain-containing protein